MGVTLIASMGKNWYSKLLQSLALWVTCGYSVIYLATDTVNMEGGKEKGGGEGGGYLRKDLETYFEREVIIHKTAIT